MTAPDGGPDTGRTGLTGLLRRGAVISSGSFVLVQVILLTQTIVIARLLTPAEVGLFAAGTVLSTVLVDASEGGLRSALVQRTGGQEEDDAETVFWVTAVIGLLAALGALAASPLIASVFDNDTAGLIAAVSSGTLVLHALKNVPDGLLQKRLDFRRQLILDPAVYLSNAGTSIALAAAGWGVWSLVLGSYASLVVWVTVGGVLSCWRPGRGHASIRLWRDMAGFAFPLLLDGLSLKVREFGETAIVGRLLGTASLGNYRYGRKLAMLPGAAIIQVCSYLLFPAFSGMADDPERMRGAFLRALTWIWFAAVPVAGIVLFAGEPAIVLVLGDEWREAGLLFAAMAGFGMGEAMNSVGGEAIKASGRSSLLNWTTGLTVGLGLGLLVALAPWGLQGVGTSISITALVVGMTSLYLARLVVRVDLGDLARTMGPPVVAAILATAVFFPLEHVVVHSDSHGPATGLLLLAVQSVGYLAIYVATMFVLSRRQMMQVVKICQRFLGRRSETGE